LREEGAAKYICKVPQEWNKPNAEIKDDVNPHFTCDLSWEATFNLLACPEHHNGHERIECIADTEKMLACIESYWEASLKQIHWNDSNYTAPTESDSTAVE
jgi:hypothetical protein